MLRWVFVYSYALLDEYDLGVHVYMSLSSPQCRPPPADALASEENLFRIHLIYHIYIRQWWWYDARRCSSWHHQWSAFLYFWDDTAVPYPYFSVCAQRKNLHNGIINIYSRYAKVSSVTTYIFFLWMVVMMDQWICTQNVFSSLSHIRVFYTYFVNMYMRHWKSPSPIERSTHCLVLLIPPGPMV